MRTVIQWVLGVIALLLVIALAVFVAQNVAALSLQFLGATFTAPVWLVALAAALAGFLVALLLILPGRVMVGHHRRRLDRQVNAREQALQDLQTRYAQVQQERDQLAESERHVAMERDRLREQLAAQKTGEQTPQPPVVRTLPREDGHRDTSQGARQPARERQAQPAGQQAQAPSQPVSEQVIREREDTILREDGPSPRRIVAATDTADTGKDTSAPHLSLGERLRDLIKGPPAERRADEMSNEPPPSSDQPTVPLS